MCKMFEMAATTGTAPLSDNDLDRVTGGIALLLPAVQGAREAALAQPLGGVNAAFGDGSVRSISDNIDP